jgi:hypothetical protein
MIREYEVKEYKYIESVADKDYRYWYEINKDLIKEMFLMSFKVSELYDFIANDEEIYQNFIELHLSRFDDVVKDLYYKEKIIEIKTTSDGLNDTYEVDVK